MPIAFTPYLAPIRQTWKSAFTATRMVGRHDGISKEMTCLRRHCEPLTNSKASPSVEDWNWLSPSIPTKAIRKPLGARLMPEMRRHGALLNRLHTGESIHGRIRIGGIG